MKKNKTIFSIQNLEVRVHNKIVVGGFSAVFGTGELHVLMGPNGSGKSSLTLALAGHPQYRITKGTVILNGKNILRLNPEEKAKSGLFLAFQHPVSLPGVSLVNFLRLANNNVNKEKIHSFVWRKKFMDILAASGLPQDFAQRDVNVGFSGGEQKRVELTSLSVLKPRVALLDEIDSGLDIDGLKQTAKIIEKMRKEGTAFLLITHTPRLLKYIEPTKVYVMKEGRLLKNSGGKILSKIEKYGFKNIK